jgi:hypothetical protein
MQQENDLLGCPFCGSAAWATPDIPTDEGNYTVECTNKDCEATFAACDYSHAAAVARWNRRAPNTPAPSPQDWHKVAEHLAGPAWATLQQIGPEARAAYIAFLIAESAPRLTLGDRSVMSDMRAVIADGDSHGAAAEHPTTLHTRQGLEKLLAIIDRIAGERHD